MALSKRARVAGGTAMLAVVGVCGGIQAALGAPEVGPALSAPRTIEWPGSPVATVAGTAPRGTVVAQSKIDPGPLQGPLAASGAGAAAPRCSCPVAHRVVHHRRVTHRVAPVLVAARPLVPLVPVYAYPPPVFYRPVVPVYGVRPFYRPYFYRPYFYRPYGYRRGFY